MEFTDEAPEYLIPKVPCCVCATLIDSNPSNMCPNCIRSHVDITEGFVKEYIIVYCPMCTRYLQPPQYWSKAEFESRELMTICLKKIRGLGKFVLIDASFIWTEAHSKRLKLKLTLQKEIFTATVIQQDVQIDYEILWQQCPACTKASTGQPQWDAVVQLRQKVNHRRTFLYLEQLIMKHRMHEDVTRIQGHPDGLDFFYGHKSHGMAFTDFISSLSPIKRTEACQLVSHDSKSNTAVQHYTFSLEICPLCREDLVLLPKMYYNKLGGLGPFVLVHKVFSSIVFIDPQTLRAGEITGTLYWKHEFQPLATSRQLMIFYVLEIQLTGLANGKYHQAVATVCLASEVGTGQEFVVQTHLGGILQEGDYVKGYNLQALNLNNTEFDDMQTSGQQYPDVVLVHKHYPAQLSRRNQRQWKLKHLAVEDPVGQSAKDREAAERERAEFEDEVERNAEFRKEIPVFKDHMALKGLEGKKTGGGVDATEAAEGADEYDDDDAPVIALEEMLDELQINEADPTGEETGAAGVGKKRIRNEGEQPTKDNSPQ